MLDGGGSRVSLHSNPLVYRYIGDHEPLLANPLFKIRSLVAGSTSNGNPSALAFRYIDGHDPLLRHLLWKLPF